MCMGLFIHFPEKVMPRLNFPYIFGITFAILAVAKGCKKLFRFLRGGDANTNLRDFLFL